MDALQGDEDRDELLPTRVRPAAEPSPSPRPAFTRPSPASCIYLWTCVPYAAGNYSVALILPRGRQFRLNRPHLHFVRADVHRPPAPVYTPGSTSGLAYHQTPPQTQRHARMRMGNGMTTGGDGEARRVRLGRRNKRPVDLLPQMGSLSSTSNDVSALRNSCRRVYGVGQSCASGTAAPCPLVDVFGTRAKRVHPSRSSAHPPSHHEDEQQSTRGSQKTRPRPRPRRRTPPSSASPSGYRHVLLVLAKHRRAAWGLPCTLGGVFVQEREATWIRNMKVKQIGDVTYGA
ncbi:hypothetical protein DFH07DRAFT_1056561 [Mycena maculata]|uniref:Uncharacterized protein n=1 Tax=Mycena maculata TaxID=230809 RepID=A0AAD7NVJ2_9AGAR|nr:hypothetical protein DFH07DRAFT_1056561 [Mycena maculata]